MRFGLDEFATLETMNCSAWLSSFADMSFIALKVSLVCVLRRAAAYRVDK